MRTESGPVRSCIHASLLNAALALSPESPFLPDSSRIPLVAHLPW